MTDAELELMLDRAAKKGAQEALKSIGLSDENAHVDIREVRDLLDAWRVTKRTVGETITRMLTTALLMALVTGIWMKWGGK